MKIVWNDIDFKFSLDSYITFNSSFFMACFFQRDFIPNKTRRFSKFFQLIFLYNFKVQKLILITFNISMDTGCRNC